MIQRDELLNKVQNGAKWDVAVAIKRGNPLPLDSTSVFESYEKALEYASTSPFAYPTQLIGVVGADSTNEYYGITQDGGLEEIGGKVDVDDLSIVINDEKIGLKGYGKQYYKYVNVLEPVSDVSSLNADAAEGSYCKVRTVWYVKGAEGWSTAERYPADGDHYVLSDGFVAGLQPKVVLNASAQLELAWFEPSLVTVEGLADQMSSLTQTVNTVQGKVSEHEEGINAVTSKAQQNESNIAGQDERIKKAFTDASYDENTGKVTFAKDSGSSKELPLTGVAHGVSYDASNLKLTIPVFGSDDVVVNIPKDKFIRTGRYEAQYDFGEGQVGPAIVLVVDDEDTDTDSDTKEIAIPASALVDVYTGQTTSTAKVSVGEDNVIKVDVAFTDIVEDHIVTVDSLGNPKDSGKTIDDIIQAINTAKSEVEQKVTQLSQTVTEMNEKIAKLYIGEGNADEILTSTADGISRSGKKVGGATLAEAADSNTVATEAAVKAAVEQAMTWKTLE